MGDLVNEIGVFATRFGVEPAVAMMLPAVFRNGAEGVGASARELVKLATYGEGDLGRYMIAVAEEAANSDAGKEAWAEFGEKMNASLKGKRCMPSSMGRVGQQRSPLKGRGE
jgi:hypothetical protein|tara:strand:+ start:334 stop:669 length:336 start_codon:yes stop_codon:yes gene_type:complete